MKKRKFNYLVGKCQYCGEEVWRNQLVDIPGLCLHQKCLEDYKKSKTQEK